MRRDFTINRYILLLEALMNRGFIFSTVYDFNSHRFHRLSRLRKEEGNVSDRFILLRQDVDRLPGNSLNIARIQMGMGIRSTFYFRSVPGSFEPVIIEEIARMGHEVGYHYEDLSLAAQRLKAEGGRRKVKAQSTEHRAQSDPSMRSSSLLRDLGSVHETKYPKRGTQNEELLFEAAIESFGRNLERLRKYADVRSICMHGSPMSKWDSRLLWTYYDYRDYGVEMEPYFDIDFSSMLYLTDTGRRWNGSNVSVRDKAQGSGLRAQSNPSMRTSSLLRDLGSGHAINYPERGTWDAERFGAWKVKPVQGSLMNMIDKSMEFQEKYNFRTTNDIIRAAEGGELPDRIMMTFHPQRWTNHALPWVKELLWQNTKNVGKYFLIRLRD